MKIGIISTNIYKEAKNTKNNLIKSYNNFKEIESENDVKDINVFLVLGGDGFLLRCLHKYYKYNIPFFGVNFGNLGFLLNDKSIIKDNLIDIIRTGQIININPLENIITDINDKEYKEISINELTLMRSVYKTCNIDISINDKNRLSKYCGDGLVVSTPIGSTAYNSSLGSPIISYKSNSIILSSISPFRPRKFRNAILQNDSILNFDINYSNNRKVSAFTDFIEYKNVKNVKTYVNKTIHINIMFNKDLPLEEKILDEQFL